MSEGSNTPSRSPSGAQRARPLVSIITVNLNGRNHLARFLDSIVAQDYPRDRIEVLVVDNGSSDGSLDLVRTDHPQVRVLTNATNVGFARANNQGAAQARGHYLALLNNDTRLDPKWVSQMVSCLESAPADVVCVGSMMVTWDGSRVDFGGATLAFNGIGFQRDSGRPVHASVEAEPEEMLFACGGALMVERDVFLATGGFDDDFFAYLEDVDFGWRLWVLGFRVLFCPYAIAYHRHNATSSRFDEYRKNVLIERNALYCMFKNYDADTLSTVLAPSLLLMVKHMALRSGIRRGDFSFASPEERRIKAPVAEPLPRPSQRVFQRFVRSWREKGWRITLRKTFSKMHQGTRQLSRQRFLMGGRSDRAIRSESYATVVAIEDLIDHLPALLEKRDRIQSARRRSDEEVVAMFGTPFKAREQPEKVRPGYELAHDRVLQALGVRSYFESGLGVLPAERTPASSMTRTE
jgi:GT2 family glycosyltransferase